MQIRITTAAPGDLDPTFNAAGYVRTGLGRADDIAYGIANQADGKVVVVGAAGNHFGLTRYNLDGSLDLTFGNQGRVITNFGVQKSVASAVRLQGDGKIVVAGYSNDFLYGSVFALARYNSDGSLDPTFDGDGRVTTPISGVGDRAFALALQGDGKIVVAGDARKFNGEIDFALVRYNSDGSLDNSFDTDGKVITVIGPDIATINAVTLYGDKIIVAGVARIGTNNAFAVARYNSDGSLDTTFNTSGKVFPAIGSDDAAFGVAIQNGNGSVLQPDKLVVAGYANVGTGYSYAVVRFNLDGSLDTTFDGDGKVTAPVTGQDFCRALIVHGDRTGVNKIVVAGYSIQGSFARFSAVRFNLNGSLDTTFDGDGKLITPVGTNSDLARALALQAGGKYVVAGSSSDGRVNDFAVVRYNSDGSLDTSFDGDGKRIDNVGDVVVSGRSMVIQPDNKIVVAGSAGGDLSLVRYNSDGSLDASFGSDGRASIAPLVAGEGGRGMALQTDGKIVTTGYTFSNGIVKVEVVRCLANGSLDNSFDGDGRASIAVGQSALGNAVAIQPDGKILVAGYTETPTHDIVVARLNPEGTLDSSFDGDGIASSVVGANAQGRAIALQPDGKILVAGLAGQDLLVVRYNPNGSLDNSFDDDGVATVSLSTGVDEGNALSIQPDGRIVVAGSTYVVANSQTQFAVARFTANGVPDVSFGGGSGKLTTHIGGNDVAYAVVNQADGKILVAGSSYSGLERGNDFAVVRYNTDGSVDSTYGSGGKVVLDLSTGNNDTVYSAVLDSTGRAVLGGNAGGLFAVVRLTTDPAPAPTPTPTPTPLATPTTLANISTRLRVETDDNVLIGGFIVTGTQPKKIIVRAIGPSLPFADKLADPILELHDSSGALLEGNDNWIDSPNKQAIIDSTIPPTNDLESAIVRSVPPAAYTAIVRGMNNGTGIGVVEAYDLDTSVDSKLANIATRGLVQTGDNVLIAGTIVVGQGTQKVIIRAIGPSLPIAGKLADPTLELHDSNGGLLEANDNWVDSLNKQAIIDSTIPPTNDLESAIVRTLSPVSYTAIVRGANDTTGIAVVEVYALQ